MSIERKSLRNTKQRQLVLDTVRASTDHPVADTIYERARECDPSISKGTEGRTHGRAHKSYPQRDDPCSL